MNSARRRAPGPLWQSFCTFDAAQGGRMQKLHRPQLLGALLACTVGISAACNSHRDAATPSAQIQSNSPAQAANSPESVTGCLRAGDAPDTFVLTTTMSNEGRQP